jgi:hypothetical protein
MLKPEKVRVDGVQMAFKCFLTISEEGLFVFFCVVVVRHKSAKTVGNRMILEF